MYAGAAHADTGGLGGKLYYAGGDISVTVLPASAGYTSELNLYKVPDPSKKVRFVATNRQQNTVVKLTAAQLGSYGIEKGDELVFGIFVRNTSRTYLMGEGARNPDKLAHARVTVKGPNKAIVGFEDLYGGGDRDYDDNVFDFSGGVSVKPTPKPPANQPPDCSAAEPTTKELWPPNHKFTGVAIRGCKDPEGNEFTIKIVSVHQDEPVKGQGSGNTAPDAVISPSKKSVNLRAERSGQGDTRVYNVAFVATDSKGASSPTTVVSVYVPHHKGAETPPKGPVKYDSTAK